MSNNLGIFETCSDNQRIQIERYKQFIYLKTYQKKNDDWILINQSILTQKLADLIANSLESKE